MADPASLEEYTERFHSAYRTWGSGLDTRVSFPCPFCGERDWYEVCLVAFGEEMAAHYCVGCGRSARFVFLPLRDGEGVRAELVQCAGPDAPAWMVPTPRREDRVDEGEVVHSEGYLVLPAPVMPRLRQPPRMRGVDP